MTQTTVENAFTFLEELKQELNGQATPTFWSILNYRNVPATREEHDYILLHFPEDGQSVLLDAYVEMLLFHQKEGVLPKEAREELKLMWADAFRGEEDVLEWIKTYKAEDVALFYEKEETFIVPDTFFLTREEAAMHLKQNHYRYHPKARAYAMTARHAPKVTQLFEVLQTVNWASFKEMTQHVEALTEEVELLRAFAHCMKGVARDHKEAMKEFQVIDEEE